MNTIALALNSKLEIIHLSEKGLVKSGIGWKVGVLAQFIN